MEHSRFLRSIRQQCEALRAAALTAGPDAPVPTCPKWTVSRLVGHVGRVHSWVRKAVADPSGREIEPDRPPQDWAALLSWFDEQRGALVDALTDPAAPAWLPFTRYPATAGSWARRQAHEAAIHRLDAEHALAGSDDPSAVPSLVFDPGFAADGIEELITLVLPTRGRWQEGRVTGTVVLHAADAGHTWTVRVAPGEPPWLDHGSGLDADTTIAGTADAVYRRVWRRPSHAVVTGNTELLEPLAAP